MIAFNIYGDSSESSLSNPTVLMANPDVPHSLVEILELRSFTSVTFAWSDGSSFNGSPIIDYTILVAEGVDGTVFTELSFGVKLQ